MGVAQPDDLTRLSAQRGIDVVIVGFNTASWHSVSRLLTVSAEYRQTVVVAYIEEWSPSVAMAALAKGCWDTLSPERINAKADVFYFIKLFYQGLKLKAALTQRNRFIGIINQISDAIVITDEARRIRFLNVAAQRLLTQSPLELLGEPEPFQLKPGKNGRIQWTDPAGRLKTIDWEEYPLPALFQEDPLRCFILRDITEQTRFMDQVIGAKQLADRTLEMHSRLMATATHEIRSPLGGVLGAASLLLQSPLDKGQAQLVKVIHDSVVQLRTLVSDLLDMAKMDQGHVTINPAPFDCRTFFGQLEQLFAAQIQASGLDLWVKGVEQLPEKLVADAPHIRQVLVNLVNNAIKFTPEGAVTVAVEWLADPRQLYVEVVDSGVGIPDEEAKRLFKPFVQLDNLPEKSRDTRGTGLGLSICDRLCAQMGGAIGYRPTAGGGSTFYFKVAAEAAGSSVVRQLAKRLAFEGETPSSRDGVRPLLAPVQQALPILIVDDDPINRSIARRMLLHLGYTVVAADNGRDALNLLQKERYAAVLLDCIMPEIDGFEVARRLRALVDCPNRDMLVIAVSGHSLHPLDARCREAGIDDTLTKPYAIEELHSCLRRHQ